MYSSNNLTLINFYNLTMNVFIFIVALTLFSIDIIFDLPLRYTFLPYLTLFIYLFITCLMCYSVIIGVRFLVSLD